ncbi:biotin/lipoyl-binding carrier protein [Planococcus salinus]|uniref:Biotin/lipoyl-binding protein n=1 Tax=Planococcus salinus TaxID=1848460 RepID=A0A3M8P8G7_9BACL|nr:biotin/lipoyl-binding carrier protein [Planococcus salinus]RNF39721.1 biotin/lipoyl-binding protein [Planococcus salinus]
MILKEVEAEITGSVWKIEVTEGQKVEEDDVLLIIESMKMEIPLLSTIAGVVKEIRVKEGEDLQEGKVAVIIEE